MHIKLGRRRELLGPDPRERITIVYAGPLAHKVGRRVYFHAGCGEPDRWTDVRDQEMMKTERGWEIAVEATDGMPLNFCFMNEDGEWDNNLGRNWSCRAHERA